MPVSPVLLALALDAVGRAPFDRHAWGAALDDAADAGIAFVTIADPPPGTATDAAGRLDAMLVAAFLAPRSRGVGIVPASATNRTEPFHVSTQVATIDVASLGRAGWWATVAPEPEGERYVTWVPPTAPTAPPTAPAPDAPALALAGPDGTIPPPGDPAAAARRRLLGEAAEHVDVVRALWDSWEDGAEIRDAATDRFLDRDRIHHVHHEGRYLDVRGPSITPRPPQGHPVVVASVTDADDARFATLAADVALVAAGHDPAVARDDLVAAHAALADTGAPSAHRDGREGLLLVADLAVGGRDAAAVADDVERLRGEGFAGVRLLAAGDDDARTVTGGVVPELARRGHPPRPGADAPTLRGRLGLPPAANRFAAARR